MDAFLEMKWGLEKLYRCENSSEKVDLTVYKAVLIQLPFAPNVTTACFNNVTETQAGARVMC